MLTAEQLRGELPQVLHTQCYDKDKSPNGIFPLLLFLLPPSPGIDLFGSHWTPQPFPQDGRLPDPPLLMPLLELLECFAPVFTLFQYFGS